MAKKCKWLLYVRAHVVLCHFGHIKKAIIAPLISLIYKYLQNEQKRLESFSMRL
nr:MAG TPA: hypothetical protein [Caudoviricetes sp.]